MQSEELYLRAAIPSDVDMLFRLANDEMVRKNSFYTALISYDEHREWFRKMMEDDSQLQFILMSSSQPIGQIRMAVDGDNAEIGYSIIPEKRGMGYGREAIRLIKVLVCREYPSIHKLTARVKPENVASIYCLEENGFRETCQHYELDIEAEGTDNQLEADAHINGLRGGTILYLTNNKNAIPLFRWISEQCRAVIFSDRLTEDILRNLKPQLVVSYNYRYLISSECIAYMQGNIVNLHISLLPWNRGSDPNFWSFVEDTPKGVTIHKLTSGLDAGNILFQKELFFDEESETFRSTYETLNNELQRLFKENFELLRTGNISGQPQPDGGTYHRRKDKDMLLDGIIPDWDMTIEGFKRKFIAERTDYAEDSPEKRNEQGGGVLRFRFSAGKNNRRCYRRKRRICISYQIGRAHV